MHKSKSGIVESAKILPKAGVMEVIRTAEGYARWYGFAPSETNASVRSMLTHLSSTLVLWQWCEVKCNVVAVGCLYAQILAPLRWLNEQAKWLNEHFPNHPDAALISKMVTDLCCNGLEDPADHIVHDVLSDMPEEEGNKKDTYHGVQLIGDSCGGPACGPIHRAAMRDLGQVTPVQRLQLGAISPYCCFA